MPEYKAWIDYGIGAIALHDFQGRDLLRQDGFSKEETLHRDLDPVRDTCRFEIDYVQSIANDLLTIDFDQIVTVEITRDDVAWFFGAVRPVTSFNISEDRTIEIEALDNSWRLKRKPSVRRLFEEARIDAVVEQLLTDAGYSEFERSEIPGFNDSVLSRFEFNQREDEYFNLLTDLLFSFGWVFYFDESGRFRAYDWAADDNTATATVNEDTYIDELVVDRDDEKAGIAWDPNAPTEKIEVPYYEIISERRTVISEDPQGPPSGRSFVQLSSSTIDEWPENTLHDYGTEGIPEDSIIDTRDEILTYKYLYHEEVLGGVFSISVTRSAESSDYNDDFEGILSTFSPAANNRQIDIQFSRDPDGDYAPNFVRLYHYELSAVVEYWEQVDTVEIEVPAAAVQVASKYIASEEDAKRLASSLKERLETAIYTYEFRAETEYAIGQYLSIHSTDLNVSTIGRVIEKSYQYRDDVDIWSYIVEGASEVVALFGAVSGKHSAIVFGSEIEAGASRARQGLDEGGSVTMPIDGNKIVTTDEIDGDSVTFRPGENGLFFTAEFIGFYDFSSDSWPVRLQNDESVGKLFVGDANNFLEWDGTTLLIQGDAQSANYDPGVAGWQINNDGDAEFNDVTVRGTVEASAGDIGNWRIDTPDIRDADNRIFLRPEQRRIEVRDDLGVVKTAMGYLGGLPKPDSSGTFDDTVFGFLLGKGNAIDFTGDIDYHDGDFVLDSDAAIVLNDGEGNEIARVGSPGAGVMPGIYSGDGNRRIRVLKDAIELQHWDGSTWQTQAQLGGSDIFGTFLPWAYFQGLVSKEADLAGVYLGTRPSDDTALMFSFDETLSNLLDTETFSHDGTPTYVDGVYRKALEGGVIESSFNLPDQDMSIASWIWLSTTALLRTLYLRCSIGRGQLYVITDDPDPSQVWSFTEHTASVYAVAVDADGFVYSGSWDDTVRKIDSDGNQVWSFTDQMEIVYSVAVDANGFVYSGSWDETVRKIDPNGNQVWSFTGHTAIVYSVAVDADGFVYSVSWDETVRKIDPDGNQVWSFTEHTSNVRGVAVDGDGFVYSASNDETVRKIDPDGNQVWSFPGHTSTVWAVAVDADGFVYSASDDETVRKIDSDGNQVWSFTEHTSGVMAVAVDADGFVYSASDDNTVRKIDPDGNQVWSFTDHTSNVRAVAVDVDGFVYSGSNDDTVRKIDQYLRDTFTPPSSESWHHYHLRRVGSNVALHIDGTEVAALSDVESISAAPLEIDLGTDSRIDDLLVLRDASLPQSEIDEYRSLGQPWSNDADTRDTRIQAAEGRAIDYVADEHRFEGAVRLNNNQTPLRRKSFSGDFAPRSDGEDFPEMEVTFFAEAGELVVYHGNMSGRPDSYGHTYFRLHLDGSLVFYTEAYSSGTWVRHASILHSFTAPESKEYTYQVELRCGSGTSHFGNGVSNCSWVLDIGGGF